MVLEVKLIAGKSKYFISGNVSHQSSKYHKK